MFFSLNARRSSAYFLRWNNMSWRTLKSDNETSPDVQIQKVRSLVSLVSWHGSTFVAKYYAYSVTHDLYTKSVQHIWDGTQLTVSTAKKKCTREKSSPGSEPSRTASSTHQNIKHRIIDQKVNHCRRGKQCATEIYKEKNSLLSHIVGDQLITAIFCHHI